MKYKKRLLLIFFSVWALILVVSTIMGLIKHKNLSQYYLTGLLPSTYTVLPDDSGLIAKKYFDKFKVEEVFNSKSRGPVSYFLFDEKYRVAIYKILIKNNMMFNDSFHVKYEKVGETVGVEYRQLARHSFCLLYRGGANSPASQIFLTLGGDSILSVAKNDSIIGYHLLCHDFSIRYTGDEPNDILFQPKDDFEDTEGIPISLDILFVKRNGAVYLLLMAPVDRKVSIDPQLLYKMVTEK